MIACPFCQGDTVLHHDHGSPDPQVHTDSECPLCSGDGAFDDLDELAVAIEDLGLCPQCLAFPEEDCACIQPDAVVLALPADQPSERERRKHATRWAA